MKIGVVGVGHLGKIHLKCLNDTPFELVGFYDIDPKTREDVAISCNIKAFDSYGDLLKAVDCVDIVSPTAHHFELSKKAIEAQKHVFIEKPITETIAQATELLKLSVSNNVSVQIGHVERYNPAFTSLKDVQLNPRFIEAHRLAMFNPRGTDVSVVLDLMIHDIDILLSMVKSEIKDVRANGVKIVSNSPDICNARVEFENGTVANLTASRISLKNMRKIRIFQDDAYISLDFLKKEAQVVKIEENGTNDDFSGMTIHTNEGLKRIIIESPPMMQNNAIVDELSDFYKAVMGVQKVTVSINDGLKALELAQIIQNKMDQQ